ncbi:hypothetical protein P3T76_013413 [Phytophthora citrophthora]|uniref:DUF5745 domain-containing protein n=1 Tax=Phytophthora citrophthora TaxID=4793 RepID=A0AAD9LDG4_9STRA|nr:hypothetical protein P3T76_013413 [Phytophthora citrophthora]
MGFGDRAFATAEDLTASVSSMSVALYEKLFQFRLRDVERVPRTRQDYENNAQVVADALQDALLEQGNDGDTVDNLTGKRLCDGDLGSIRRLLTMLEQVYTLLFEESQEIGDRLRDVSIASLGMTTTKRRAPPKVTKKQKAVESAPKSDDPEQTRLREKRMKNQVKTRRGTSLSRGSQKQEEVRVGRAVSGDMRRKGSSVNGMDRSRHDVSLSRAEAIEENNKKRSRLLEESFKASNSRAEAAAKKAASRRQTREGSRVKARQQKEKEVELLETKRYGRFVAGAGSSSPEEDKASGNSGKEEPTAEKRTQFFEGVSSVHHISDESMHFMEDEGVFAQNFSSVSIEDVGPEHKEDEAAAEDVGDRENFRPNENIPTQKPVTPRKSANHQEAEEDNELTPSPVKKKVAREDPHAPERASFSRTTRRDKSKSLYPLLPKTRQHAATSKAQAQYLRYKLSLKNHLLELRQREASQRQHLERAYKSGEHMANVDKIRSRRFEQDVRLHRIAIGLEAKNEEEKQLRQAMSHLLDLEKEKLREEHRVTTSVLKRIQKEHAEREQAMENFYANQIQLVKEKTRREVKERELVEKAQRSASEKMMRELRHERENQLTALLQEKQHLEETRRFRHTSHMAQLLENTDERAVRRTDAFYTAAMKARKRHTVKKQQHIDRRTSLDPYRTTTKPLRRSVARLSTNTFR